MLKYQKTCLLVIKIWSKSYKKLSVPKYSKKQAWKSEIKTFYFDIIKSFWD